MNVFNYLSDIVYGEIEALGSTGALPAALDLQAVSVEPPREAAHGDAACNAALVLAQAGAAGATRDRRDAGGAAGAARSDFVPSRSPDPDS